MFYGPVLYLHFESGILLLFLAVAALVQLARAQEPGHYVISRRLQWIGLVLAFVFLTAALEAYLVRISPLLALELSAGILLALLHPVNALSLWILLLFLRPWEIVSDNAALLALPRLLGGVCALSWLLHPSAHARPTRPAFRALFFLGAFSFWSFLSTFRAASPVATQAAWLATYLKAALIYLLCLFFIRDERDIRQVEWTLMLSALALIVTGLYQYFSGAALSERLESVGLFGDPNDLAAIVIMAIPFALVPAADAAVAAAPRLLGMLFSALALLAIWYTKSRGALLGLAVQALLTQIRRGLRGRWLTLLLLAAVLGGGYLAAVHRIPREAEEMQESSTSRLTYWKTAVNMSIRNPLLGVGFGQYPDNYETYRLGPTFEWGRRTAHSSWLLAFAESGLPGGLLYLAFFFSVWRTAWRHRSHRPAQLYALGGYAVVMTFLSHTYAFNFFFLAGLIMASDRTSEPA